MPLSDVVNVKISRETTAVSQAGFGILNIVGPNLNSENRIEYFSTDDLTGLGAKLYGGSSAPEYIAALAAASANPKPSSVAVSQAISDKLLDFATGTWTAGDIKITVNGTEYTVLFNTNKTTSIDDIATAIQAHADISTAVALDDVITVTPVEGALLAITVDLSEVTGTLEYAPSTSVTEAYNTALDAIKAADNDWYGLILTSRVQADVELVAVWAEANEKQFVTASADTDIVDTTATADTTSIAAVVKAAAYARTYVLYDPNAATKFGDAGWLAGMLARIPGSYTGMFKKAYGTSAAKLLPSQSKNALDKNANVYELIGGVNILRESKCGEGEYFDIIHFADWVKARVTEAVFALLARSAKIPYTPEGLISVRGEIDQVLQQGVDNGGFSQEDYDENKDQIGGYSITIPAFESISSVDKSARILNNVKFKGYLAGAIHAVTINGTVVY